MTTAAGTGPARASDPEPVCVPRGVPAQAGRLDVLSAVPVGGDGRVTDYTMASPALGQPHAPALVHVDVLLPLHYDASPGTRYPVLLLLHGHGGDHRDWADHHVESLIDAVNPNVIVVMPDGGYDGFYSDWYGTDLDGHNGSVAPGWETFHLGELLPWVDATYRTFGTRAGRAIAGLSMGGFGATSYAARHPDLFSAVGTFSGATDSDLYHPVGAEAQSVAANAPDRRPPDQCIWGDPVTHDVTWQAHNPTELASNLALDPVSVWYGDGVPDPGAGAPAWNPGAGATEAGIAQENQAFVAALQASGQHPSVDAYGAGTHDWFYWERDLHQFLRDLPPGFFAGSTPGPSGPFGYESGETAFSVWGWTFGAKHPASGFTYLMGVTPGGFDVRGSGRLFVLTPLAYARNMTVTVTDSSSHHTTKVRTFRDAATGRLAFSVELETPHTLDQVMFGPSGATATFPTVFHVTIGARDRR